ncbi:hypothetical protein ACQKMD_12450 [Viridibacillus sp. NPDC096237]
MKKIKFAVFSLLSFALFFGAFASSYAEANPGRLHFITAFLNSF